MLHCFIVLFCIMLIYGKIIQSYFFRLAENANFPFYRHDISGVKIYLLKLLYDKMVLSHMINLNDFDYSSIVLTSKQINLDNGFAYYYYFNQVKTLNSIHIRRSDQLLKRQCPKDYINLMDIILTYLKPSFYFKKSSSGKDGRENCLLFARSQLEQMAVSKQRKLSYPSLLWRERPQIETQLLFLFYFSDILAPEITNK